MKHLFEAATGLVLATAACAAFAHGATIGSITIAHPFAFATPPGATTGGAYLKDVVNEGAAPDALVGVTSPAAETVQIHDMQMDGNVMRMRAIPSVALAPGRHVAMRPGGGVHLMFIGLKKGWAVGDRVPVTLQFEKAGRVDVLLDVEDRNAAAMDHPPGMKMP